MPEHGQGQVTGSVGVSDQGDPDLAVLQEIATFAERFKSLGGKIGELQKRKGRVLRQSRSAVNREGFARGR
jgi:hypothetical protein